MALLLDFISIIFIVIISFLFCNSNYKIKNSINNSSCLLSHIIVGFSVIIFYKLASRFKLNDIIKSKFNNNNEHFNDDVNDFINGTTTDLINPIQASTLTPIELTAYSSKLDAVINGLTEIQKEKMAKDPLANTNPDNLNSLDLTAQQQYQMFQIDYLNKQIQNVQDIISVQNVTDTTINYKPIKVFSSCVVANANGTTTTDRPVSSSFQNTGSSNSIDNNTDTILNTVSQSNGKSNSSQLSSTTGLFNKFLSNIQTSGNGNINIDALK